MLEVIGAGWGRTGTSTLKSALNKLGYNTYHMTESIAKNDEHLWHQAMDGKLLFCCDTAWMHAAVRCVTMQCNGLIRGRLSIMLCC